MKLRHTAALALVTLTGWLVWPMSGLTHERGLNATYTRDNSDWWSVMRLNQPSTEEPEVNKPDAVPRSSLNFVVARVNLWGGRPISDAETRIGPAPVIARGDAASSRSQLCYDSAEDGGRYKLIFEEGEVACDVYLIEDGASWNGVENCVPSDRVSEKTATESGLHLGMSVAEVKAILGRPSRETTQKIIYSSVWQHRLTPQELRAFRRSGGPGDELNSDRTSYIEARFRAGRANYIAITVTETY